eukprot:1864429-Karenia_brevis.AAC.1
MGTLSWVRMIVSFVIAELLTASPVVPETISRLSAMTSPVKVGSLPNFSMGTSSLPRMIVPVIAE